MTIDDLKPGVVLMWQDRRITVAAVHDDCMDYRMCGGDYVTVHPPCYYIDHAMWKLAYVPELAVPEGL